MDLSARLKSAREALKLTQDEIATQSGIPLSTYQKYELGLRQPGADQLQKLAKVGIDLNWLITGIRFITDEKGKQLFPYPLDITALDYVKPAGSEPLQSSDGEIPRFLLKDAASTADSFARIPFYDVRASAGHGAFVADQEAARFLAFDREWLAQQVGVAARRLALIPVSGTSMEPDLHDGDLVMIDRGDIEVLREGVYVFELDDRLYVKRLSLQGDRLVVASSNGDYPPLELNTLQENPGFKIHGRVLGSPSFKRL